MEAVCFAKASNASEMSARVLGGRDEALKAREMRGIAAGLGGKLREEPTALLDWKWREMPVEDSALGCVRRRLRG